MRRFFNKKYLEQLLLIFFPLSFGAFELRMSAIFRYIMPTNFASILIESFYLIYGKGVIIKEKEKEKLQRSRTVYLNSDNEF